MPCIPNRPIPCPGSSQPWLWCAGVLLCVSVHRRAHQLALGRTGPPGLWKRGIPLLGRGSLPPNIFLSDEAALPGHTCPAPGPGTLTLWPVHAQDVPCQPAWGGCGPCRRAELRPSDLLIASWPENPSRKTFSRGRFVLVTVPI